MYPTASIRVGCAQSQLSLEFNKNYYYYYYSMHPAASQSEGVTNNIAKVLTIR
jgi:hypothetical protein